LELLSNLVDLRSEHWEHVLGNLGHLWYVLGNLLNVEFLVVVEVWHWASLSWVLADQLGGGLLWVSDLQESVVRVNTRMLTLSAQVIIIALGALVADTHDWIGIATITDDVRVGNLLLRLIHASLLNKLFDLALVNQFFNLFSDD